MKGKPGVRPTEMSCVGRMLIVMHAVLFYYSYNKEWCLSTFGCLDSIMAPVLQALMALTVLIQHRSLLASNVSLAVRNDLAHVLDIRCISSALNLRLHSPPHTDFERALTISVISLVSIRIPLQNVQNVSSAVMADALAGAFLHDAGADRLLSLEPRIELLWGHVHILLELPVSTSDISSHNKGVPGRSYSMTCASGLTILPDLFTAAAHQSSGTWPRRKVSSTKTGCRKYLETGTSA